MKDTLNFNTKGVFEITRKKTLLDKLLLRSVEEGPVYHSTIKECVESDIDMWLDNYTVQDIIGAELIVSKIRSDVELILSQCFAHQVMSNSNIGMKVNVVDGEQIWGGFDGKNIELPKFAAIVTGVIDSIIDSIALMRSAALKKRKASAESIGNQTPTLHKMEPPVNFEKPKKRKKKSESRTKASKKETVQKPTVKKTRRKAKND